MYFVSSVNYTDEYDNFKVIHLIFKGLIECGSNSKSIIYKLILQNSSLGTKCGIALRCTTQDFID